MKKFLTRIEFFLLVMVVTLALLFSPNIFILLYMIVMTFVISWVMGGTYYEILYNSNHCSLTGIYNRRILENEVPDIIKKLSDNQNQLSVCFFDIDNFKKINDTKGHIYGDKLLVLIAKRFRKHIRKTDYFVRYGGDEFLLICPYTESEKMYEIVNRVLQDLSPLISLSYGIASFPDNGNTIDELIEFCDKEMYSMKRRKNFSVV